MTLVAFRLRELARRLDLKAAVRNRPYSSGVGPDGLPLPPTRLMTLVAGAPDIGWFLDYGQTSAWAIRAILRRNGVDFEGFSAILDFGCGCGRVLRHLSNLQRSSIHGCDYNPELVAWCRENLPFATVAVNDLVPPLEYASERFSLVYALSVFTHLPEDLQHAWVAELARILEPGGYLLITTQGDSFLGRLTDDERVRFNAGGLIVRHDNVAGTNLCAAFHPRSYLEERLFDGFEVIEFASVSRGETDGVLQDMTLVRKPA